ncbi:MAG: hypothetical protein ABI112_00140 [Terracoccus sp.]
MPSGTTLLTGEAPDVTQLCGILQQRGLSTTVVDEAYARSLEVTDPLGAVVVVNETQTDTYGYEAQRPEPDPGVEVVLSRFTDPAGLGGPGPKARVALGFYTTRDLEPLQERLSEAGFDPGTIVSADFGSRIETLDPDGQRVEIHHRSR